MTESIPLEETKFPIATLYLEGGGRIGVCPLPGSQGDLAADLTVVKQWKPAIVLSMTETPEMEACGSDNLGSLLADAGIDWKHLPIRDFGGPVGASAAAWPRMSVLLNAYLDRGAGVLIHCRGGQGRSGMIALRLLVGRGEDAEAALHRLRHTRPGAVETEEQLAWASEPGSRDN